MPNLTLYNLESIKLRAAQNLDMRKQKMSVALQIIHEKMCVDIYNY